MSVGAKSAGTNPLGLTAIANLVTGVFVFTAFPSTAGYMGTLSAGDWTVLLILGIIQIGAGYGFYNLGIQKISAQKASVIALWEMILGPVWVALFLKEYPTPLVLTGFIIILAGMLLDSKLTCRRQAGCSIKISYISGYFMSRKYFIYIIKRDWRLNLSSASILLLVSVACARSVQVIVISYGGLIEIRIALSLHLPPWFRQAIVALRLSIETGRLSPR